MIGIIIFSDSSDDGSMSWVWNDNDTHDMGGNTIMWAMSVERQVVHWHIA